MEKLSQKNLLRSKKSILKKTPVFTNEKNHYFDFLCMIAQTSLKDIN